MSGRAPTWVTVAAIGSLLLSACSLTADGDVPAVAESERIEVSRGPVGVIRSDAGLRQLGTGAVALTGTPGQLCLEPAPGVRAILDCSVVESGDESLAWTLVTTTEGGRRLSIYRGDDVLVEFLRAVDRDRTWRRVQVAPSKLTSDWVDDLVVGIERWTDEENVALELDIVSVSSNQLTHRTLPAGRARVHPDRPDVIQTWQAQGDGAGEDCCSTYRYEEIGFLRASNAWSILYESEMTRGDVPFSEF